MATVKLGRVITKELDFECGKAYVRDNVLNLSLHLTDVEGAEVSVAFDTRADIRRSPGGTTYEEYRVYSDCPIKDTGSLIGPMNDVQTMRTLRDALNKLNLGDDDE